MKSPSPGCTSSRSLFKALASGAALVAGVALSPPAAASESFQPHLAEKVGMPCVPACTLCHFTNVGGADNLRPGTFVETLLVAANGTGSPVQGGVPESLDPGLAALMAMPKDTDGDGAFDLDELKAGTDPSGGAAPICDVPKYGCGASVANTAPTRFGALALALSVMLALGLRRRH